MYRWTTVLWELIFIYCGLFVLILVGFFLCCFFFPYVSTLLSTAPRALKGDQGRIFWSDKSLRRWISTVPDGHCQKIAVSNPTQAGQRFTWSKTWCDSQQLWKAVIIGDTVTRLIIPIRGRGKITWRRPEVKFGRNVGKEETTQQKKNYQDEDKMSAINKNEFSD